MSDRLTDERLAELSHRPQRAWLEEVPAMVQELIERRQQETEQ